MPYKDFQPQTLIAKDVNQYLMNQSVMTFASASDRQSKLTSPVEGMVTYLNDTNKTFQYDGANWLEVVKLDSAGRLINPTQICFTARIGGIRSTVGYITYTSVFTNVGGHFSTSTGRFTAPVAGNYLFMWQGLFRGNTAYAEVTLYKNGANIGNRGLVYDNPVGTSAHSPSNFNVVLNLAVNDWVQPYLWAVSAGSDYYLNESLSQFSGMLIG